MMHACQPGALPPWYNALVALLPFKAPLTNGWISLSKICVWVVSDK